MLMDLGMWSVVFLKLEYALESLDPFPRDSDLGQCLRMWILDKFPSDADASIWIQGPHLDKPLL